MISGGCVVYCLNVTSRIKDYAFQINRLLQNDVKRRKIQGEECKMYDFTAPNGVISTKTNEIAGHFGSFQLIKQFAHSWKHLKRGLLIYNFIL